VARTEKARTAVSEMTMVIKAKRSYARFEQFSPFELLSKGDLEVFHDECAGGRVESIIEGEHAIWRCTACHAKEKTKIMATTQALRRLLTKSDAGSEVVGSSLDAPVAPNSVYFVLLRDEHADEQSGPAKQQSAG
jgi:hypothetical protein